MFFSLAEKKAMKKKLVVAISEMPLSFTFAALDNHKIWPHVRQMGLIQGQGATLFDSPLSLTKYPF